MTKIRYWMQVIKADGKRLTPVIKQTEQGQVAYDLFDENVKGFNEFDFVYRGSILGSYTRLEGQSDADLVCELMQCAWDLSALTGTSSNYIYVRMV